MGFQFAEQYYHIRDSYRVEELLVIDWLGSSKSESVI